MNQSVAVQKGSKDYERQNMADGTTTLYRRLVQLIHSSPGRQLLAYGPGIYKPLLYTISLVCEADTFYQLEEVYPP